MYRNLAVASALVSALTLGAMAVPAAAATTGAPQPWAETGSVPSPARPVPKRRATPSKRPPVVRVEAPPVIQSGEAAGSVERPRASTHTRAQVRRDTRAWQNQRRSADGFEHVGGEGGTRTVPR